MRTIITGGSLVTPHQVLPDHSLVLDGGTISAILSRPPEPLPGDHLIDARGKWVTPGFIDVHTHGALGVEVMHGSEEALHNIARFYASHGVTSYYPTTWSATPERTLQTLQAVARASQPPDGARHLGVHVEGPYINTKRRGAQRLEVIRDPDPAEYRAWLDLGIVRLVTLAPELNGAMPLIDILVEHGVEVAIGHTRATYEEAVRAADHGARQATHLFNAMESLHHREPGALGACLADGRIYTQIIPDGVHLHPAIVKLTIQAKTPSRVILVTDSIAGTGMPDGDYEFDGQQFTVQDGIARAPDGALSGSTLTLDQGVRNVLSFTGLPLTQVLPMATSVPAEAMGLAGRKGVLQPEADADVLLLSAAYEVEMTIVGGKVVFGQR